MLYDSISWRFNGLTDNRGTNSGITVTFYLYDEAGNDFFNKRQQFVNLPQFSTRNFRMSGLTQNTVYVIKAQFDTLEYSIEIPDFLGVRTISTAADTLNATLVIDDVGLTTTSSDVNFTIADFQSPSYVNTDMHTVTISAISFAQARALSSTSSSKSSSTKIGSPSVESSNYLLVNWDFEYNQDFIDQFDNYLQPLTLQYEFDQFHLITLQEDFMLQFVPNDWGIFESSGSDFTMIVAMTIPVDESSSKFSSYFQNNEDNKGYFCALVDNSIIFQGFVRLEDGNSTKVFFETIVDISEFNVYGTGGHEYRFQFTLDPEDNTTIGVSNIFVDNIQIETKHYMDVENFSPLTLSQGAYMPFESGSYVIQLPILGTKLAQFRIIKN